MAEDATPQQLLTDMWKMKRTYGEGTYGEGTRKYHKQRKKRFQQMLKRVKGMKNG